MTHRAVVMGVEISDRYVNPIHDERLRQAMCRAVTPPRERCPAARTSGRRLRGKPAEISAHIPTVFAGLERAADRDASRGPIESYRRLDEVDFLVPVMPRDRLGPRRG